MNRPAVRVLAESTVLRCMGPHPYANRLPEKFGGRTHGVQVGFPVPFQCKPTGRVWSSEGTDPLPGNEGRILIQARCQCGSVTEYEVVKADAQ